MSMPNSCAELTEIIENHLADFQFDVEKLSKALFMSRRQLLRRLKAVAGCAPNAFIRAVRLKKAAELLKTSGMTARRSLMRLVFQI